MGKGVTYGDLPFPGIGCHLPDVANIYLIWKSNVWATVSTIFHLPRMFLPMDFLIEKFIFLR